MKKNHSQEPKEHMRTLWKGLDQCCVCQWFGTYTPCKFKCRNKNIYIVLHGSNIYIYRYIYMILYGYVKQFKYMTM